jgi:hypothetical protein
LHRVGIAQSANLADTIGCDSSRVAAIGRQPFDLLVQVDHNSPQVATTAARWALASWHHSASSTNGRTSGCQTRTASASGPRTDQRATGAPWLDAQVKTHRGQAA